MLDQIKRGRREADLVVLEDPPAPAPLVRRCVRAQNFLMEWVAASAEAPALEIASVDETMLILPDVGATIGWDGGTTAAPRRSLVVLVGGSHTVRLAGNGHACILSTSRTGTFTALNARSYETPDPRVAAVGTPWARTGDPQAIQVFEIDRVQAPADNPRLKMFQSATMSINWVDYDGPRDRRALSPHKHADFEQCSLAVAGDFIHHLRVDWGKNADEWREDQHLHAPSPSILVIPPDLIHTTEGVGPGHHLLIDVFAPPRRDFIARKWVANAAEYRDPLAR